MNQNCKELGKNMKEKWKLMKEKDCNMRRKKEPGLRKIKLNNCNMNNKLKIFW